MTSFVIKRSIVGPIFFYLAISIFLALLAWVDFDHWLPFLYLLGALTAFIAWNMRRWPDQASRFFSFGALLLLMCALNRCLYFMDYFISGLQYQEWPFSVISPRRAMFKGEAISVVGVLFTVFAWGSLGGARITPSIIFDERLVKPMALLTAYVISLIAMLISKVAPTLQVALGQLLTSMLGIGLVASYLWPAMRFRSAGMRLLVVVIMAMPFAILAAGTGMKENMILSMLPLAITAWLIFRSFSSRLMLVVVGVLVLGLMTSYVNFYREDVWYKNKAGVSTEQVVRNFSSEISNEEGFGEIANGAATLLKRNNASWYHGWAVAIADEQSYHPELVLSPMLYVFIPRVLWAEKPANRQGWEYSGIVFGPQYVAWSDSSTAAGLYPAFYLGAGWFGVLFGALFVGAILAWMTKAALKFGGPLGVGLYLSAMLPFILRLDETWPVGALSGPVITMIYVVFVARATGLISGVFLRQGAYYR